MGNAITSLKYILALDYTHIFESLSQVEKILGADEIYAKMDKKTKNYYRRNVERIAKKMGISEVEVALSAIELAAANNRHVGYYLIESDLGKDNKKQAKIKQTIYWTAITHAYRMISALALYCYSWTSGYTIRHCFDYLIPSSDIAIYMLII